MTIHVVELLSWAADYEKDAWTTLPRRRPVQFHIARNGIEYLPERGQPRLLNRKRLQLFLDEFHEVRSFAPGAYPEDRNKSYTLALIHKFLDSQTATASAT